MGKEKSCGGATLLLLLLRVEPFAGSAVRKQSAVQCLGGDNCQTNKPLGSGAYDCNEVAARRAAPLAGRQAPSNKHLGTSSAGRHDEAYEAG